MDTDAALAVVDLALRYGLIDRMDQAIAGLRRLGWVPEPIDGTGTCLDTKWQYPPSNNMWRVRTGYTDDKFYIGLSVNTDVDAAAVELADRIRSVVEQWPKPADVRYTRHATSEDWADEFRMIDLHIFPAVPAGPGKAIPPGLQLSVESPEG